jgi:Holliday junction resolvasome RuvABC endonuclease subunit
MTLLGLDLSVTATAVVGCPLDWDGQWSRVSSLVVGEKLRRDATDAERARRTETIALRIVAFARARKAEVAFLESYAYSQRTSAHTLGELGGVVRLELLRAGIEIRTAPMSTARKLLLGTVPRSDVKTVVFSTLRAAGARFETCDESDAFTALNFGMAELGGYCFAQVAA